MPARAARRAAHAIAIRRLVGQHLTSPFTGTPAALVRHLGAIQSQDYPGAKWAIGLRSGGVSDADVEREYSDGRILRTHVLRPTWHFVHPEDIRWMLELTAPRVKATMATYDKHLELDEALLKRTNAAIERALRDGTHLTRQELAAELRRVRLDPKSTQRLSHIVMRAELDAIICSGPRRGKQFTYALLEERAPNATRLERDEALRDIALRYFTTRSPATPQDFSWWSGLTIGDARRAIDAARPVLVEEQIDGRMYWSHRDATDDTLATLHAHLLPNYDEFFIGYRDRSAIGQRIDTLSLLAGWNALTSHILAIDGQVVGGWKRVVRKEAVVAVFDVRLKLSRRERGALAAAAKRLAEFLGTTVMVETAD